MMLQSILVALDWGETVDAVAGVGADAAMALDASVRALYVEDVELIRATEKAAMASLPLSVDIPVKAPNIEDLELRFRSVEKVLAKRILKLLSDTRIHGSFLVAQGEVDTVLVQESRAHDLLVMGKYSETSEESSKDRPLGRHVERVLRHTWCPVMLVPPGAILGPRFLIVYDGTAASHRALAAALRLGRATQAEFSVLAVGKDETTRQLLDEASAYLDVHGASARMAGRQGDQTEAILREVREWKADLLVMGAFARDRHRGALGIGVALDVLKRLDRPALISGSLEE